MTVANEREIVVGADGSASSVAAVRWALEEAAVSGRTVAVLRAWTFDPVADLESAVARSYEEIASRYRHELDATVVRASPGADLARVRTGAIDGAPGPALVRSAEERGPLPDVGNAGAARPDPLL
ncbi:universal stress protein [Amycolatopsis circi]|uniref:universal stress protein n=1 Tax=Amycolatopsis circi TaxID=871959 RepID=UPI000E27F7CC|nr:universal stress protein [Amycolatopsis circi]